MTHTTYWLIASAAFFALEAFGVPGIGFLFAGIAAILVALLTGGGLVDDGNTLLQLALFLLFTSATAALLWKKLKTWRLKPGVPEYHNMVGTEAVVVTTIPTGGSGTVRWSGTLMNARHTDATAAPLSEHTTVKISAVDGNTLIVTPK